MKRIATASVFFKQVNSKLIFPGLTICFALLRFMSNIRIF